MALRCRLYAGLMPYFDRGNVAQECKVGNTGALPAQARSKRVSSLKGNQWSKLTVPGIVSKSRLLSDPNTPWRAFGFFLLLLYPQSPVLAQRGTEAVELKGGAVGADNFFQFSRNGKLIAAKSRRDASNVQMSSITVWETATGSVKATLDEDTSPLPPAFNRDSTLLVSVTSAETVALWDLKKRKPRQR